MCTFLQFVEIKKLHEFLSVDNFCLTFILLYTDKIENYFSFNKY
jgi:hypothetical protein